jgi:hypothetical protein
VNALSGAIKDSALSSINLLKNNIPVQQAEEFVALMESRETPLTTLCGLTGGEIELDFSGQGLKDGDAVLIANDIRRSKALSSLHLGMNNIPEKEMTQIMAIAATKDSIKMLCEVPFKDKTITELDVSGKRLGIEGALVLSEFLRNNTSLSKFDISNNYIGTEGGKALAEGLEGNQHLTDLDISWNGLHINANGSSDRTMSASIAIADAVEGMHALRKFCFNESARMEVSMIECDFSSKCLSGGGAVLLAAFLPKCK